MSRENRGLPERLDVLLLLLAATAGGMDAISYLLAHVFPANMTGNTVVLGLYLAHGDFAATQRAAIVLGGYLLGAAAGMLLTGPGHTERVWTAGVTRAVAAEAVVLGLIDGLRHVAGPTPDDATVHALIALSGVAMGMQSAAVLHLDVRGVSTTYITGTLTNLVGGVVDRLRSPAPPKAGSASPKAPPHPGLLALVWVVYLASAAATGFLATRRPVAAPLVPLGLVVAVTAAGAARHGPGRTARAA